MALRKRTGAFIRGGATGGSISFILRQRGKKAVEMAAEEVKKQAEIIRDDAKSRCPVLTGKLAESIKVVEFNNGLYCQISADARNKKGIAYGQFVEFDPRISRPFLYPAFDAHRDEAAEAIMEAVRKALTEG